MTLDIPAQKRMPLHTRILLGLFFGSLAGVGANLTVSGSPDLNGILLKLVGSVTEPFGQVFLRLLFMVVIPLVLASLTLGVAGLGDLRKLGRIGLKTFSYFLLVTTLAVVIGLVLVNSIKPGVGLRPEVREQLLQSYRGEAASRITTAQTSTGFGIRTLVDIIPRNPIEAMTEGNMLSVIFFSLMLGVALTKVPAERARPVLGFLEGLGDAVVVIIDMAMKLAPYGVFALIFSVTARFGFDILKQLALFVFVVLLGLSLHQFVVYSILVKLFSRLSPVVFFRRIRSVMITAFSTSSSNATLPTTIRVAEEELGVPKEIAGFVLPLGSTINMNGTALFEGVTAIFLAQVFGVHLTMANQMLVVVLSVMSAIGTAGVPGGSIPLLVLVIQAIGVPAEGIAVIIGVDRILDMCRTVLNVTGDITTATFVARSEGFTLR